MTQVTEAINKLQQPANVNSGNEAQTNIRLSVGFKSMHTVFFVLNVMLILLASTSTTDSIVCRANQGGAKMTMSSAKAN